VFGVWCNIHQVRGCKGSGCSGKYSTWQREVCLGFLDLPMLPRGSGCSVKYSSGQREV